MAYGGEIMEDKGLVFDIQSYSVHDGPGCRTTCFFSGCFLKCEWCANPESWDCNQKVMFAEGKCKVNQGCSRCIDTCSNNGIYIKDGKIEMNWNICSDCKDLKCVESCYNEALKKCGKLYSVDDLLRILNRDRQFWSRDGGVTFSGGEPFYQKDFLLKVLKRCKESYIHTAIETTAFVETETFLKAMEYIDFAFIDLKHMDREKHKEKTGVYNDLILKNIIALKESKWNGRLVLRTPIIEDYNDNRENFEQTADFMNSIGLFEINILPFHRMGDSKWNQLGKSYKYKEYEATSEEKLEEIQEIFLDKRIACYIGSETSF